MDNNTGPRTDGLDAEDAPAHGISRRTIVKTAAWSVPVITMATATPAFAASVTPTLIFTNGPYAAGTCDKVTTATIQLTTDGVTPNPGQMVTVSLPTGLKFADGSTTKILGPTIADGTVTLPPFTVSPDVGDYSISATGPNATTAVSTVSVHALKYYWPVNGSVVAAAPTATEAYPVGSQAIGADTWLTPTDDLYYKGTLVASGVTGVSADLGEGDIYYLSYLIGDQAYTWNNSAPGAQTLTGSFPIGTKAIGADSWLTPAGDLYYNTTLVASGVDSASADLGVDVYYLSYLIGTQGFLWRPDVPSTHALIATYPVGSTTIGVSTWLTPSGDLYFQGLKVASGVTAASAGRGNSDLYYLSYMIGNQAGFWRTDQPGAHATVGTFPTGTEPIGASMWLTPTGDLYFNAVKYASTVTTASTDLGPGDIYSLTYATDPVTC